MNETIFKEAQGKDSCVIELTAIKTKVESKDKAGAFIKGTPYHDLKPTDLMQLDSRPVIRCTAPYLGPCIPFRSKYLLASSEQERVKPNAA